MLTTEAGKGWKRRLPPVGTRGGRGDGWGPGACPGRPTIRAGAVEALPDAVPTQDKHQAPSSTPPAPLSLQDAGALPFPDLIVKIRQDVSASIAEFDCHYSLSSLVDSRSILLKSIVCINSLDLTTKRH